MLTAQVNDASATEEKEKFFIFSKAAFKRVGVLLRLLSIPLCFLGIILSLALPTVAINYANYSSSTTFSAERAARFPTELISGWNATFGQSYFSYYLKSRYGVELLYTAETSFNAIMFWLLFGAFLVSAFAFAVTFSKKLEKYSKVVLLGYILAGIGVLCSPVWFMFANSFANNNAVLKTDLTHYFVYDSLYVHDGYGSIVACFVFVLAAVLFAIGTSRENAGGDDRGESL